MLGMGTDTRLDHSCSKSLPIEDPRPLWPPLPPGLAHRQKTQWSCPWKDSYANQTSGASGPPALLLATVCASISPAFCQYQVQKTAFFFVFAQK